MHEEKYKLLHKQIKDLAAAAKKKKINKIYAVSCGGSLATLYPFNYIISRETKDIAVFSINASEFYLDPPAAVDKNTLVILNSQSGGTPETVEAARVASGMGALTAAYTTAIGSTIEEAVDYPIYYYDNPLDPFPLYISIFPEVYLTVFALLDALCGTKKLAKMDKAMLALEDVNTKNKAEFEKEALEFAKTHKDEKLIYTVAAGLDTPIAYILCNCSFMESVWKHSSPINAGELFHGACEAIDKNTPVVAFLGLGSYRPLEERAVKFLRRITDRLTVLDAKALDLSDIPEEFREYVAPLVLHSLASEYCDRLSFRMGHPMSSRRYMGVMKF